MSLPPPTDQSLAHRTVRNIAWLGGSQAIRQVVSIGTTLVLARYLGPTEFGIFAMTLFVNELAQLLVDFGMGSALIQRKSIEPRLLSSCFWINVGVGAVVSIALVAAGPSVVAYFGQPAIQPLLVASGLNLVIASLIVLPQSLLARRLAFREIATGTLIGSLAGAAASIGLATAGAGVWALAFQPLIGTLVNGIYLFACERWRPSLVFDWPAVRDVMRFSGQLFFSSVVGHVTRNLPSLILGPAMGAAQLGLVTMAQTIAWLPVAQLSSVVVRATFPAFALIQDSPDHFRAGLYRASGLVALLAFPALTLLATLARDLIPPVFGAQWGDIAPLVMVLCALSVMQSVSTLAGTTLLAAGRSGRLLTLTLLGLPLMFAALWTVRTSSAFDAVVALSLAGITIQVLTLAVALRAIQARWSDYLGPLMRPLGCCVLMAIIMIGARSALLDGARLGVLQWVFVGLLGVAAYAAASAVFNRARSAEAIGLLRRALGR